MAKSASKKPGSRHQTRKSEAQEEAVHLIESGQPLNDDVFAVSFDDCYKGWINYVLPECQRLRLPFAVFVTTGPLDTDKMLLYDALIYLAKNTWRKVADLSKLPSGCSFNPRCHKCTDICLTRIPDMKKVSDNRYVACHLY